MIKASIDQTKNRQKQVNTVMTIYIIKMKKKKKKKKTRFSYLEGQKQKAKDDEWEGWPSLSFSGVSTLFLSLCEPRKTEEALSSVVSLALSLSILLCMLEQIDTKPCKEGAAIYSEWRTKEVV